MPKYFLKNIIIIIVIIIGSSFFGLSAHAENWYKCKTQTAGCLNTYNALHPPDGFCIGNTSPTKDFCCLMKLELSAGWCTNPNTPYACYKTLSADYNECVKESEITYHFSCDSTKNFASEAECKTGKVLSFDLQPHYLSKTTGGSYSCFLGTHTGDPDFPTLADCKVFEQKANAELKYNLYDNGFFGSYRAFYCDVGNRGSGDNLEKSDLSQTDCAAAKAKAEKDFADIVSGIVTLPPAPTVKLEVKPPQLEINIPQLTFSSVTNTLDEQGYIHVPYIGEYIAAIYKFSMVVISIISIIMIIVAGAKITVLGGEERVNGFKKIGQIVIGLFIAWGSYGILYTINPALVNFDTIKVLYIKPIALETLSNSDYSSITGQARLPKAEILKRVIEISKNESIDPCYMIPIVGTESGGNPGVIGHDELNGSKGRKKFLASGVKYSGATFTPGDVSARNDDGGKSIEGRTPPDFGIDWRFSHGLGLGQITLDGRKGYHCNEQRGIKLGGHCFNIPELFTADGAILAMVKLFKNNLSVAGKKGWTGDDKVRAAYWGYAAGNGNMPDTSYGKDNLYAKLENGNGKPGSKKMVEYLKCKGSGSGSFSEPAPEGGKTEE